jgi:LysM repeat protein
MALALLYFLGQGEKKEPERDLQPLLKKIGLLEERMAKLESKAKESPQIQEKVDSLTRNLNERLSHLEKDINQIKEEATSVRRKAEVTQPAEQTLTAPPRLLTKPGATRSHTVGPGDTLYRIALRYGLSVEALCRLNNLRPDQSIRIGQKLSVGAAN